MDFEKVGGEPPRRSRTQSVQGAPKLPTSNLPLKNAVRSRPYPTLFVSSAKCFRKGATHHPAFVTLRRGPPPYALTCTGMIGFAPNNKLIQSARSAPQLEAGGWRLASLQRRAQHPKLVTSNLPLAT